MTHVVRLFARARDLAGADHVTVDLPDGATVADLRRRLGETHPRLADLLARSALAVADEFAADALVLPPAAEIALLPPVSPESDAAVVLADPAVVAFPFIHSPHPLRLARSGICGHHSPSGRRAGRVLRRGAAHQPVCIPQFSAEGRLAGHGAGTLEYGDHAAAE